MRKFKDYSQDQLDPVVDQDGVVVATPILQAGIPSATVVSFDKNAQNKKSYDFGRHYGQGFDAITSAVQQTIEIMLTENTVRHSTISSYCANGFTKFAEYMAIYHQGLNRELVLSDITTDVIEHYIQHLKRHYPNGVTAKARFASMKPVLVKMQGMGWLERFEFPKSPFPNSNRKSKGQKAFSKAERSRLAYALKESIKRIMDKNEPLTGYELSIFMLAIAMRSGMNPTPLIEMTVDSIKPHPFKDDKKLLVLYKRRGNATHIQALRHSKKVENVQDVLADVAVMVQHIIDVNRPLRAELGTEQVFCYRSKSGATSGQLVTLDAVCLAQNTKKWVEDKRLKNDDGEPLVVNISRFRKTFENRIWELSGGDPFVTAALANHSVNVSVTHYLEAPKASEKNFNFMGKVRTKELIPTVTPIEQNTPVSKCSDIPHRTDAQGNKIYCTDFLSCVRCRNMVVTKEDLYRLFSFYWLIVYERDQIGAKRWSKYFAHIIRIIDRDIAPQFDEEFVRTIKVEAQANPHPAWKHRNQLEGVA